MRVHMYTTKSRFWQRESKGDGINAVSIEGVKVAPDANIHIEVDDSEVKEIYSREHKGVTYREYVLHPVKPPKPRDKWELKRMKRKEGEKHRRRLEQLYHLTRFPATM